jgi:serine phosphatase RsbU (regulator of sigma subunit)
MKLQGAVAKVNKYAVSESGDTFEMVERPHGGLSFILADGQRSGRSAKAISNLVVRKAMTLLAEGVRDGAAARAAHDYLYTHRQGKVLATLNIVSIDLVTRTIVVSRNSHCPVLIVTSGDIRLLDEPSQPIGVYRGTKPVIAELPVLPDTYVVVFTDGILTAGERQGRSMTIDEVVRRFLEAGRRGARELADSILDEALTLDQGRPVDDTSILVLAVLAEHTTDGARRVHLEFPLPDGWVQPGGETERREPEELPALTS